MTSIILPFGNNPSLLRKNFTRRSGKTWLVILEFAEQMSGISSHLEFAFRRFTFQVLSSSPFGVNFVRSPPGYKESHFESGSLFYLARPERFELPTFWFVARHSIQLSYGRSQGGELSFRAAPMSTAKTRFWACRIQLYSVPFAGYPSGCSAAW